MQVLTTRLFILLSISALLGGCAGTKDTVLPQDGPTMKAIYDTHFDGMNTASTAHARLEIQGRPLDAGNETLEAYSRTIENELDTHFPRLPNPMLVMYVFPHLSGPLRVPVPGYSTTFPLYERPEYALPGEIPVYTTLEPVDPEAQD